MSHQGKPETWKAWRPCPMGFSEGNRDSPVGGLAELLVMFPFLHVGGRWLAGSQTPHLERWAPSRMRGSPRPSVQQKTDGPSSSGSPGNTRHWSREAGTPAPHSKTASQPRKEVWPP